MVLEGLVMAISGGNYWLEGRERLLRKLEDRYNLYIRCRGKDALYKWQLAGYVLLKNFLECDLEQELVAEAGLTQCSEIAEICGWNSQSPEDRKKVSAIVTDFYRRACASANVGIDSDGRLSPERDNLYYWLQMPSNRQQAISSVIDCIFPLAFEIYSPTEESETWGINVKIKPGMPSGNCLYFLDLTGTVELPVSYEEKMGQAEELCKRYGTDFPVHTLAIGPAPVICTEPDKFQLVLYFFNPDIQRNPFGFLPGAPKIRSPMLTTKNKLNRRASYTVAIISLDEKSRTRLTLARMQDQAVYDISGSLINPEELNLPEAAQNRLHIPMNGYNAESFIPRPSFLSR
ncbi:hypothetical protein JW930_01695 [Candidatus Woesearchaeota archaeon]|nr:hypothetical protein [Candidatus Woesearchaeota archaeon]